MLSDFEYRYLRRNGRRFKMTQSKAAEVLALADVPLHPMFVEFQTTFGGYCPDEDVTYGIVGPSDQDDEEPRSTRLDQLCLARCDLDNRTQIRLQIDENGLFYHENIPVAESFESYIRFQAYCDITLQSLAWTYIDYQRRETKKFKTFFDRFNPAPVVNAATDKFHSIHKNDQYFEVEICGNRRLFVRPDLLKKRK